MAPPPPLFATDSSSRFKEDPRVKIHRVILLFSLLLTIFDMYILVRATQLSCYYVIEPLLQGFATLVPDLSLILVYYTQIRAHATKRLAKDAALKSQRNYYWSSFGNLFWRLLLLGLCLFWPVREVKTTGQLSVLSFRDSSCSVESLDIPSIDGRTVYFRSGGPTLQTGLIPFLKMTRVRTSIFFAIAVLMVIEIGFSAVARFQKVREDVRKTKEQKAAKKAESARDGTATGSSTTVVPSVDTIELGAMER